MGAPRTVFLVTLAAAAAGLLASREGPGVWTGVVETAEAAETKAKTKAAAKRKNTKPAEETNRHKSGLGPGAVEVFRRSIPRGSY